MFNTEWVWINPNTKISNTLLHGTKFISIKKLKNCVEIKFYEEALLKYNIKVGTKIGVAMNKDNTAMAFKINDENGYSCGKVGSNITTIQIKIANSKINIPKIKEDKFYVQEEKVYKQENLFIIGFKNLKI